MTSVAGIRGSFAAAVILSIFLVLGLAVDADAAPNNHKFPSREKAVENMQDFCENGQGGQFSAVEGTGNNAGATFTWCDSPDGTTACKVTAKTWECSDKTTIVSVPKGPEFRPTTPTTPIPPTSPSRR